MKVFEVVTEFCESDSTKITTERQYVTSQKGTLKSVVDYFTQHCEEYKKDLKVVAEALVIVQHIKTEPTAETRTMPTGGEKNA